MRINEGLLRRLRNEAATAASVHAGLATELMSAQQWEQQCGAQLDMLERRLASWPNAAPPAGVSIEDYYAANNDAQLRRSEHDAAMRAQFRDAGLAQEYGNFVASISQPTADDFIAAVAQARRTARRAAEEVARIMEAQGKAAQTGGALRQTVNRARDYLLNNGHGRLLEEMRL
jgi:hypothetical protein